MIPTEVQHGGQQVAGNIQLRERRDDGLEHRKREGDQAQPPKAVAAQRALRPETARRRHQRAHGHNAFGRNAAKPAQARDEGDRQEPRNRALFHNAAVTGKRAAGLASIVDLERRNLHASIQERERGGANMMEIALGIL